MQEMFDYLSLIWHHHSLCHSIPPSPFHMLLIHHLADTGTQTSGRLRGWSRPRWAVNAAHTKESASVITAGLIDVSLSATGNKEIVFKKKNNKEERRGIECSAEKSAKTLFKYGITKHLEHLQFWLIQSHSLQYLYKNPTNLILVLTWSNLGISKYDITSCGSIKSPENSRSDKLFTLYNEL